MKYQSIAVLAATIALAAAAPPQTAAPQPGASVTIANFAYAPATLTIAAGTTVRFRNDDSDAHTVTADDGMFDSGGLDAHGTYQHTFDQPGTYRYVCAIHPWMKGTIVVTPR
ncbi:amidase [bacterium]|nr:MAG: amidase [bacterium]